MPQLIVNADDLGFSPGTNEGIISACKNGIVTSTTVMVNLDYAEDGLRQLKVDAPHIGIGLHINLTHGRPVSSPERIPSLVDDTGNFYAETQLLEVALNYDGDELYEEIAAQIERFIALTGNPPTHLDSHYHIAFLHPLALEATLSLATEYGGLPMRSSQLDDDPDNLVRDVQRYIPNFPADALLNLLPMLQAIHDTYPAAYMPAYFENGFNGANTTLGDLLNILTTLPEDRPTEIMCHPGILGDPLNTNAPARFKELETLIHPTAREVIGQLDIELIHYGNLHIENKN